MTLAFRPSKLLIGITGGALGALPDILLLAKSSQVICIQESLLLPTSNVRIPGYTCIRSDLSFPGARGLCIAVRADYRFSLADLTYLSHPTAEMQAILLHCSLDSLS